jgi:hypothetical protein
METTDFHRYARSNRVKSFQYKFDISFLSYKLNAESIPTPTKSLFLNTPVSLVLYNQVEAPTIFPLHSRGRWRWWHVTRWLVAELVYETSLGT